MATSTDTLTDTDGTNLVDHTGEGSIVWAAQPGSGSAGRFKIQDNRAYQDPGVGPTDDAFAYASVVPASADYSVTLPVYVVSAANNLLGPAVRMATGAKTSYFVVYNKFVNRWELYKYVAGTATALGNYSQALSTTTEYAAKLDATGTSIKFYVDGVERISATDSAISDAGRGGIAGNTAASSSTGMHASSWTLEDAGGGAVTLRLMALLGAGT
jgi:hypothetical protein